MSTGKKRLLAYIGMIVALSISVKLVKDIIKLSQTDERVVEAENELEEAREEQEELNKKLAESEGGEWREEQVRNTLRMAKSNEVVVIVPEEVLKTSEGIEGEINQEKTSMPNWKKWRNLFIY